MKRRLILIILFVIFMIGNVFAEESFEFEWDEDDIRNGVKILFYDLEDKEYDVKLWIDDEGELISDRQYGGDWKSGWFYMGKLVKGPGNGSEKVKLRIDEKFEDFKGDAQLIFKIRGREQIERDIEVLKMKKVVEEVKEGVVEDVEIGKSSEENIVSSVSKDIEKGENVSEIILLGKTVSNIDVSESEDIKSRNNIVYESKTEVMKKYSVYVFALFCVMVCVLVIWRKLE